MSDFIFINGDFMAAELVAIDPADRGFLLGDGVFDTLLAVDGKPVDADAHFTRLAAHAAMMDIPLSATPDMLAFHAVALIERNEFKAGRYALRTTLSRGPAPRGLRIPDAQKPTLMMRAAPAPPVPEIINVVIANDVRRNEGSPLSRIKSLNYADNVLAMREAARRGADDAIILNNRGAACCATAANIFAVLNGQWLTPPLTAGVLDGITRRRVVNERKAHEQSISPDDLRRADALYLSNSVMGLVSARLID